MKWNPCPLGEFCQDYYCKNKHPPSRFLCRFNEGCLSFECKAVHPLTRVQLCDDGQSCIIFHCWGLHPHDRIRPCRKGSDCINLLCIFLHPTNRILLPLPEVPALNPTAQEYYPIPSPIHNYHYPHPMKDNYLNPITKDYIPPHLNPTAKEFIPPLLLITKEIIIEKKKKINICNICYDELNKDNDKVQCNSKSCTHIFCIDCFINQVKYQIIDENVGKFIQSNRRIICSLCLPNNIEFDDTIIALHVGSNIFNQYRKANETALEVEVCRREKDKNQKVLLEMREAKKDSICYHHRLFIAENILTLCCPRCKVPFIDFEGCFAISCHACNCQFCAWCLKDCGLDAHSHVKICPNSLAPGGFYGQLSQFNTVHVTQRKKAVISYLEKLPYEERIATQAVIINDLKDLGIVIP